MANQSIAIKNNIEYKTTETTTLMQRLRTLTNWSWHKMTWCWFHCSIWSCTVISSLWRHHQSTLRHPVNKTQEWQLTRLDKFPYFSSRLLEQQTPRYSHV